VEMWETHRLAVKGYYTVTCVVEVVWMSPELALRDRGVGRSEGISDSRKNVTEGRIPALIMSKFLLKVPSCLQALM
jgi:hypothetical protein